MTSLPNNTIEAQLPLYYREPQSVRVVKLIAESLIALFGILGNISVCIVVTRRMHMRTVMNLYICNLAVADLGVLIICFPLALVVQELVEWPLGRFFCEYIYPASDIFFGGSIWSITVIAIERYRNIVARERIRHSTSKRMVLLVIGIIWFASFFAQCFPLYLYMEYKESTKSCQAYFPPVISQMHNWLFVVLLYVVPLSLICWTYVQISHRIHQSTAFNRKLHDQEQDIKSEQCDKEQLHHLGNHKGLINFPRKGKTDCAKNVNRKDSLRIEEKRRLKQNSKARRILTPLVVIFATTMLPFHVGIAVRLYSVEFVTMKYFWLYFSICAFLIVLNSSLNPLIYAMVSKDFRKAFKRMFVPQPGSTDIHRHSVHCESDNTRVSRISRRTIEEKETSKSKWKIGKLSTSSTKETLL